jgi:hypothetical protein
MSLSLYELSTDYIQALDFLTDPEISCDLQTTLDTLEGLSGELDDKLLNVGRFISTIEADAEAIKKVENRQKARRQALENKALWLRDYLQSNMDRTGRELLHAPDIALSLAKLPPSVVVTNEELIPPAFWKETVTRAIDKLKIREAGGCPGAVIESKGYRISIK